LVRTFRSAVRPQRDRLRAEHRGGRSGSGDRGLLLGYLDAVHDATSGHLRGVTDADLDRVVDTAWDPPVTLGVRPASVISDGLEHAGQGAYVRGIAERR